MEFTFTIKFIALKISVIKVDLVGYLLTTQSL